MGGIPEPLVFNKKVMNELNLLFRKRIWRQGIFGRIGNMSCMERG